MTGATAALVGSIGQWKAASRSLCGTVRRGPLAIAGEPMVAIPRAETKTAKANLRGTPATLLQSKGTGEGQGDHLPRASVPQRAPTRIESRARRPDVVDQQRLA